MRGKKPKEREKYIICLGDGTLVEVGREVYLEWYRSRRRERYQKERDRKYGVCSIEKLHEKGCFPEQSITSRDITQEAALWNSYRGKLRIALDSLPEQDATLIKLLYFEERTIKDVAGIMGCSRKTVAKQRDRILEELRQRIERI